MRALILILTVAAYVAWGANGHFKEVNGTAAVEAENYWENNNGKVSSTGLGGTPDPISGDAFFITCENRTKTSAKWKVDFTETGTYKIYILGSADPVGSEESHGFSSNNFGLWLGESPEQLRSMNSTQNCTRLGNNRSSCVDYEANMPRNNQVEWLGYGDGSGNNGFYQCVSDRGCKTHSDVGTWNITAPGTWHFGIHTGDEPFFNHGQSCNGTNTPSLLIDKFVFTKGGKPSGAGPTAVLSDGSPISGSGGIAAFAVSGIRKAPVEVSFDASESAANQGVSISSYSWDFGDGESGSGKTASHTYTENRMYTVKLTVKFSDGKEASAEKVIEITDPSTYMVKINAGHSAKNGFAADQAWSSSATFGYEGGEAVPQEAAVEGTDLDAVFSTVRHQNFSYHVKVPAAQEYTVQLLFAEFWRDPGARIFTVAIESQQTEQIDIAQAVGTGAAYVVSKRVTVSDGVLDLQFNAVKDNPMISGIIVSAQNLSTPADLSAPAGFAAAPSICIKKGALRCIDKGRSGTIALFAPNGACVLSREYAEEIKIRVSHLARGSYTVHIKTSEKASYTRKVLFAY